jgi:hypothetical protein
MSIKRLFMFDPGNDRREAVLAHACDFVRKAGRKVAIVIQEPTRSLEQNDRMWALLTDISRQVQWPVDGRMQYLKPEDWKHILSAGLKREQRVAQGIDGGFVILGQRTSKMSKRELSDLMELIEAFGAMNDVAWGDEGTTTTAAATRAA